MNGIPPKAAPSCVLGVVVPRRLRSRPSISEASRDTNDRLGRVDGFHQDKGAGERDKGGEVLCRLLAAQGDAFEALDLADALFGAGASFVEYLGEERRFGGGILAVRDGGGDAAPARRRSLRLGVVAFVAEHRPRGDVRANVEQDLEVAAVAGLAAGQVEGQRQAIEIALQVAFAGKDAARPGAGT